MYLRTWFVIDFVSVIPFDLMLSYGDLNNIARVSRIGKIYRLIKISKLARLLKSVKVRSKMSKFMTESLKISFGLERMMLMLITFVILQHIAACIWVFIGKFDERGTDNWIFMKNYIDTPVLELYITSVYFTVTTVLTVGYGDISAYNIPEMLYCILLMLIGVLSFSFASGALASIIQSYDSKEAQLKEKIATLNDLAQEYEIG
jgi:hypothetical protein